MDCQVCGKRPATIHFTELSAGAAVESHICQECAEAKGLFKPSSGKPKSSIGELLSGLSGAPAESEPRRCPRCGETYAEFRESGRLGCEECYVTFADLLRPLLRRVHGSTQHSGKRPAGSAPPDGGRVGELVRLRDELRRALEREDFERCAEIRDRIRKAEGRPDPA